jgi:hypothetical protein
VSKDVDCQVFADQLDALMQGTLPEEGVRQLRLHAESCPECAIQLKVQEHLARPSLAELEAQVPDDLVASMWGRVKAEVGEGAGARVRAGGVGPRTGREGAKGRMDIRPLVRWIVPMLAAATLVLLFSTGFLFLELGRLRDREAVLAQQVAEQQHWLSELEVGASADPVARTAALAGRNPWLRALSRQETISVGGLRTLLERMPGDRMVMSGTQLDTAIRSRYPLATPLLRAVLDGIQSRDGVRARDLLQVLEGLDVSPEVTVSTSDLMDLLS